MKRALFSIGMTSVLLICLGWSGNAAAQGPPVDDGTTLIFLLKPGADMTRVGNIISGAGGTVLKSTTIHTGQRILKVQVPAGTSADAEKSIGAMADPDICGGEKLLPPVAEPRTADMLTERPRLPTAMGVAGHELSSGALPCPTNPHPGHDLHRQRRQSCFPFRVGPYTAA
jgi:hypothetical protein